MADSISSEEEASSDVQQLSSRANAEQHCTAFGAPCPQLALMCEPVPGSTATMTVADTHMHRPLKDYLKRNKEALKKRGQEFPVWTQPSHDFAFKKLQRMWHEDLRLNKKSKDEGALVDWSQQSISSRWERMVKRKMQAHYMGLRSKLLQYIKNELKKSSD